MFELSGKVRNLLRLISGLGVILLSTMSVTGPVHGQTLEAGGLTGEIRSATASVPPEVTTTVLFVPADSTYILTQACLTVSIGLGTLTGSVLGDFLSGSGCTLFTPGLAFQPGELITFTGPPPSPFPVPVTDTTALITGVLVNTSTDEDD